MQHTSQLPESFNCEILYDFIAVYKSLSLTIIIILMSMGKVLTIGLANRMNLGHTALEYTKLVREILICCYYSSD